LNYYLRFRYKRKVDKVDTPCRLEHGKLQNLPFAFLVPAQDAENFRRIHLGYQISHALGDKRAGIVSEALEFFAAEKTPAVRDFVFDQHSEYDGGAMRDGVVRHGFKGMAH